MKQTYFYRKILMMALILIRALMLVSQLQLDRQMLAVLNMADLLLNEINQDNSDNGINASRSTVSKTATSDAHNQRWSPRGHILKSLALASSPRKLACPRLEDSTIF